MKEVVEATARSQEGGHETIPAITEGLRWLVAFYPRHIDREDKAFFPRAESYFYPAELERLLRAFYEFDRTVVDS